MTETAPFIFVTCQVGAEAAVKAEVAREWPESRFAFSRPGFLTFKLPPGQASTSTPTLHSVFARAIGWSIGPVQGATPAERAAEVWRRVQESPAALHFDQLHVWPRDVAPAGYRGFEPGGNADARAILELLMATRPAVEDSPADDDLAKEEASAVGAASRRGERVLDCILIEENTWWIGHHRAWSRPQSWPGGFWPGAAPAEIVSRAYLKISEALDWSGLAVHPGQTAVEIGCAPGGASQALLDRGLKVIGVDPADVDPRILAHPNFTHLRKRGMEVPRRQFRGVDWLMADMNVPPAATLATLRGIVTHEDVQLRGVVANLKLTDWKLAAEVPEYLAEVARWGFDRTAARQLGQNRQEFCVAAWNDSARK